MAHTKWLEDVFVDVIRVGLIGDTLNDVTRKNCPAIRISGYSPWRKDLARQVVHQKGAHWQ